MEEIVRQVGHLPELYEDARLEKYIKKALDEKKKLRCLWLPVGLKVLSGSLSLWHGAFAGCGWIRPPADILRSSNIWNKQA